MIASDFIQGYVACAIWSSTDEDGEPLDSVFSADDLSPAALAAITADCEDFLQFNETDLRLYSERRLAGSHCAAASAGHDFWLTRNGHGAGFWDRGLGELGARLTRSSKPYGSCDLYVGDDGFLYIA